MRVQFVAAEIFPLAKTGGLADVCAALPRALAERGVDVRLTMPAYESALDQALAPVVAADLGEVLGVERVRLLRARAPDSGLPLWLVDAPALFRRSGGPYQDAEGRDWPDNARRFAVLAHAAARIALGRAGLDWVPDVVHCHDWHAGLVPLLLRAAAERPASLFTVHNMSFQGTFPESTLGGLGLPVAGLTDGLEFYGQLSFLKAGLSFADGLTTVSETYAREIQTPEFGHGLDGLVRQRASALTGILNGIDTELWNPRIDPFLAATFARDDLAGKRACKAALQSEFGLDLDPTAPLMISVCRLTGQKMADVVLDSLPAMLSRWPRLQFALLGRGEAWLEHGFMRLAQGFPGRVSVRIGYDERQAHRLHGGGDMILHGSRFEPCGLAQMYAMRYGTVPVVSRVGGLADTVCDADSRAIIEGRASGVVFGPPTAAGLTEGVARALDLFSQPVAWRKIQRHAMVADFSWRQSAKSYHRRYRAAAGAAPCGAAAVPVAEREVA